MLNRSARRIQIINISCKPKKYENQELFEYSLDNEENNKDIADNIDECSKLLLLISQSGTDVDEIIRSSNRPSEEILMMIMELILVQLLHYLILSIVLINLSA